MVTSLASFISGGFARLICHPIDTIKAKIQVGTSRIDTENLLKHGILSTARQTIKEEGIRGLYRGIGIATLGSAPALCLYFTSYELCKRTLKKHKLIENEGVQYLVAGFVAETISCIFWVPVDVIKERLQVQSSLKSYNYANSLDAVKQISQTEGLRGLYKGYGATLCSFGPFSALYFFFYEKLKAKMLTPGKDIHVLQSLVLSGLAGSAASFLTNGLDMSKLRMQVQRAEKASGHTSADTTGYGRFGYRNIFHGVALIVQREGFLSLFKGSLSRILYHTPSTAITMSLFESSKNFVRHSLQ